MDAGGTKGTLVQSLPKRAPLWDSAVCLGTAGCKDQEWVTSRVQTPHDHLKRTLSKFLHKQFTVVVTGC